MVSSIYSINNDVLQLIKLLKLNYLKISKYQIQIIFTKYRVKLNNIGRYKIIMDNNWIIK